MTAVDVLNRMILLCRDYVSPDLSDEEILHHFQSVRVRCVSDENNLQSLGGQTALVTLVLLLNRMGVSVELAIPEVGMIAPQPPLSGAFLRRALLELDQKIVPGAGISMTKGTRQDLALVLGNSPAGDHDLGWRLYGTDWAGSIASLTSNVPGWTSALPVGSMVSGALGSAEVFKYVVRRMPLASQGAEMYFREAVACSWDFGAVPEATGPRHVELDVISGGAISQAALYALLRFPRLSMRGRVLDDDLTAATNLNRNMLSLISDIDTPKVRVVSDRCSPKFELTPVSARFEQNAGLAPIALVGVDHIPSRWHVQRQSPEWLGVGGTSHFSVSSSSHQTSEACAGCLHPVDDLGGGGVIPTVSFVSFWAGLATAVRLLRQILGVPYEVKKQHLFLTPLRMDQPKAAMWLPVPALRDCPVRCGASRCLLPCSGGRE